MNIIEPGIKYGIMYRMVLLLPLEITLCGVHIQVMILFYRKRG